MINEKNMEKFAYELKEYFEELDLWYGTRIYFNNKALDYTEGVIEDIKVKDYLEYCNPETVSIAFDGSPLYDILNNDLDDPVWKKIHEIADKYGLYGEMGYSWSVSFYE